MKGEPPAKAVAGLDEQGQDVESRPHPETPAASFTNRNEAGFAASPLRFRDSDSKIITILRARSSMSATLLQPSK